MKPQAEKKTKKSWRVKVHANVINRACKGGPRNVGKNGEEVVN